MLINKMRKSQSGVMLLEALIAILIFSLGILGLVGMQASAVRASRDAQFRSQAGLLANQLVGQMWSGDRVGATLVTNSAGNSVLAANATPPRPYEIWTRQVEGTLPGVAAAPPIVTVVPGNAGNAVSPRTASTVAIDIRWKAPNEVTPHSHKLVISIF